jgi:hypothetical protein
VKGPESPKPDYKNSTTSNLIKHVIKHLETGIQDHEKEHAASLE